MNDRDTIQGLRILLDNAALQVQALHDAMTVGAEHSEQAKTARKACELAGAAIEEGEPVLRKLARKPGKGGAK